MKRELESLLSRVLSARDQNGNDDAALLTCARCKLCGNELDSDDEKQYFCNKRCESVHADVFGVTAAAAAVAPNTQGLIGANLQRLEDVFCIADARVNLQLEEEQRKEYGVKREEEEEDSGGYCVNSWLRTDASEKDKVQVVPPQEYEVRQPSLQEIAEQLQKPKSRLLEFYRISYARLSKLIGDRARSLLRDAEIEFRALEAEFQDQTKSKRGWLESTGESRAHVTQSLTDRLNSSVELLRSLEALVNASDLRRREFEQQFERDRETLVRELLDFEERIIGVREVKSQIAFRLVQVMLNPEDAVYDHQNVLLLGPPGTGKTEIANRAMRIFSAAGLVQRRDLPMLKISRSGLVSGIVGATAPLTRSRILRRLGGSLFIDEIYSLLNSKEDAYGIEAIDAMVEILDAYKGLVMLFGAGYEKDVYNRFLGHNEGMDRRFPNKWRLRSYNSDDLTRIFQDRVTRSGYQLTPEAQYLVEQYIYLGTRTIVGYRVPRVSNDESRLISCSDIGSLPLLASPSATTATAAATTRPFGTKGSVVHMCPLMPSVSSFSTSQQQQQQQQQQKQESIYIQARGDRVADTRLEVVTIFSDRNAAAMEEIFLRSTELYSNQILLSVEDEDDEEEQPTRRSRKKRDDQPRPPRKSARLQQQQQEETDTAAAATRRSARVSRPPASTTTTTAAAGAKESTSSLFAREESSSLDGGSVTLSLQSSLFNLSDKEIQENEKLFDQESQRPYNLDRVLNEQVIRAAFSRFIVDVTRGRHVTFGKLERALDLEKLLVAVPKEEEEDLSPRRLGRASSTVESL